MIAIDTIYQGRRDAQAKALEQRRSKLFLDHPQLEEILKKIDLKNVALAKETLFGTAEKKQLLQLELIELQMEKDRYFAMASIDPNDLKLQYFCDICKDRGYVEDEQGQYNKCVCMLQLQEQQRFGQAHLTKRIAKENFETFDLSLFDNTKKYQLIEGEGIYKTERENILDIMEMSKAFIHSFQNPATKSLFFHGEVGLGKSFMCSAIAKELLDQGKTVLYLTMNELMDMMQLYNFNRDLFLERYAMEDYYTIERVDLLILDDLGAELTNSFVKTVLFNIINSRMINNKKMLISTNLSPDEIQDRYDERIFSRLVEYTTFVKFFGENKRWSL